MSVSPPEEKLSVSDFAQAVKAKYPGAYDSMNDADLVDQVVRKNPVYADQVRLPSNFKLLRTTSGAPLLDDLYERAGKAHNVDPNLLLEQGRKETSFKPSHVYGRDQSTAGAVGLAQFMPETAKAYDVTDRTDPEQSAMGQAKYMRKLLDQFNGREDLALAGYNAGEHRTALKQGRIPNIPETQDYVRSVTGALDKIRGGIAPSTTQATSDVGSAEVSPPTSGVEPTRGTLTGTPPTAAASAPATPPGQKAAVLSATNAEDSPEELARVNASIAQQDDSGNPLQQESLPVTALTHFSDAELFDQARNAYGGKGTAEQINSTFRNLKTKQQQDRDNAIAEAIKPPENLTEDQANQYLRHTLKEKYPDGNFDKFTFLNGYRPGHTQVVTFGDLKDAGLDADALIHQKTLEQQTESPTPDLSLHVQNQATGTLNRIQGVTGSEEAKASREADPLYQQAIQNLLEEKGADPLSGVGMRASDKVALSGNELDPQDIQAEYTRLQARASDDTRLAKQAGESRKDLDPGFAFDFATEGLGRLLPKSWRDTIGGGEALAGSAGMNLLGGLSKVLTNGDDSNFTRYLRNIGVEMGAAGEQEIKRNPGFGSYVLREATKLPQDIIRAGLLVESGGPIIGFGAESALESGGRGETRTQQLTAGLSSAATGVLFGGGQAAGELAGGGIPGNLIEFGVIGGGTAVQTAVEGGDPAEAGLKMMAIDGLMKLLHMRGAIKDTIDVTGKLGGDQKGVPEEFVNKIYRASDGKRQLFFTVTDDGKIVTTNRPPSGRADIYIAAPPTGEQIRDAVRKQIREKFGGNIDRMSAAEPDRQFVPSPEQPEGATPSVPEQPVTNAEPAKNPPTVDDAIPVPGKQSTVSSQQAAVTGETQNVPSRVTLTPPEARPVDTIETEPTRPAENGPEHKAELLAAHQKAFDLPRIDTSNGKQHLNRKIDVEVIDRESGESLTRKTTVAKRQAEIDKKAGLLTKILNCLHA